MYNFLDYQLPDISFFVMKSALFVQANVAVNTKLTSKVPFLFGNFQVFFKKLVKNVQFRYGMTGMKILFRCPFQYPKVPLEAGAPPPPPPPPNLLMLPTPLGSYIPLSPQIYMHIFYIICTCNVKRWAGCPQVDIHEIT
jgi:hypothetical protein